MLCQWRNGRNGSSSEFLLWKVFGQKFNYETMRLPKRLKSSSSRNVRREMGVERHSTKIFTTKVGIRSNPILRRFSIVNRNEFAKKALLIVIFISYSTFHKLSLKEALFVTGILISIQNFPLSTFKFRAEKSKFNANNKIASKVTTSWLFASLTATERATPPENWRIETMAM